METKSHERQCFISWIILTSLPHDWFNLLISASSGENIGNNLHITSVYGHIIWSPYHMVNNKNASFSLTTYNFHKSSNPNDSFLFGFIMQKTILKPSLLISATVSKDPKRFRETRLRSYHNNWPEDPPYVLWHAWSTFSSVTFCWFRSCKNLAAWSYGLFKKSYFLLIIENVAYKWI